MFAFRFNKSGGDSWPAAAEGDSRDGALQEAAAVRFPFLGCFPLHIKHINHLSLPASAACHKALRRFGPTEEQFYLAVIISKHLPELWEQGLLGLHRRDKEPGAGPHLTHSVGGFLGNPWNSRMKMGVRRNR